MGDGNGFLGSFTGFKETGVEKRRIFNYLFNQVSIPIQVYSPKGERFIFNPAFQELMDGIDCNQSRDSFNIFAESNIFKVDTSHFLEEVHAGNCITLSAGCVEDSFEEVYLERIEKKLVSTNTPTHHQITVFPVRSKEGNLVSIAALWRDISEFQHTKEEVVRSKKALEQALANTTFLRDLLLHDMTNILHSMSLTIDLIKLEPDIMVEKMQEYNQIIWNQLDRAKMLVKNVRDLVEIDNEGFEIKEMNLMHLVNESIDFIKGTCIQAKIVITVECELDQPVWVRGNRFLFSAFENILHNAVKHNNNERVMIWIILRESDKNKEQVIIEFRDNGNGIPDSLKENLFSKKPSLFSKSHGMGIGLSLVKEIISNCGGSIVIDDRVKGDHSQGCCFEVHLPLIDHN